MISLPDFREKQLLLIQAQWRDKPKLKFTNENIVFTKHDEIVNRASCHKVFAIYVIGDISVTTKLIRETAGYGISLYFLKHNFETYSSCLPQAEGHYYLRSKQYTMSQDQQLAIAKNIVRGKLINQQRLLKETGIEPKSKQSIHRQVDATRSFKDLLGVEGSHTRSFFAAYFNPIDWRRRAPRTKEDIPNFLLDIGYNLLFNFIDALLRMHGFDTYKGCYHRLFFGRKSLACDIQEPFRCLVDKQLVKAYNLGQIDESDFSFKNGQYMLSFDKNQKYAQIFMRLLMDNKEDIFNYVHEFYRHVMNPEENPFPEYKVRARNQ
ncbi:hypothetical protein BRC19_01230 [Candidatus Saccharibacteria bacterium QS_5_54_17]|nr:MAG: hypothetical protein BRC19_01230 [Candidatus Saccharibacteria bacterium QS_5_54_17]